MIAFRALGVAHVLTGALLLPCAAFFGLIAAPILALGPLWIIYLGARLWKPNDRLLATLRTTHSVTLVIATLMVAYGIFALRAAERSAAAGGGLLGGFGFLPIALGILVGGVAGLSLLLVRRRGSGGGIADS